MPESISQNVYGLEGYIHIYVYILPALKVVPNDRASEPLEFATIVKVPFRRMIYIHIHACILIQLPETKDTETSDKGLVWGIH